MALYQCKICEGEYVDPQRDGGRYFHSCAPIHNPDYDAQFELDEKGDLLPKGPLDPAIKEMLERPDKRNENVETKPNGKVEPITNGEGKEQIGAQAVKKLVSLLLAFSLSFLSLTPYARSANVEEACITFSTTDVPITTTAETVVATSEACTAPGRAFKAAIKASFLLTTSAGSATYKVRIRRETLTGNIVGDEIARTIQVPAAGTEEVTIMVAEERAGNVNKVVYVATIEIASASAESTVGEAYIEVLLL